MYDSIAAGQRRADLVHGQVQRKVERRDRGNHAHRLAHHHPKVPLAGRLGVHWHYFSSQPMCLLGRKQQSVGSARHFGPGLANGLAALGHDGEGDRIAALEKQRVRAPQDGAALVARHLAHHRRGRARRSHRGFHVLPAALEYRGDRRAVIRHLHGAGRIRHHRLPADSHGKNLLHWHIMARIGDATIRGEIAHMKGLTDIDGILVGHATDTVAITGCTAIIGPPGGMTAGVDVRGAATGSMQLDVLAPLHSNQRIHGICLSGGSAYGLEAGSGVMRFLERKGIGFPVGSAGIVPLVPSAILFDLGIGKKGVRPGREMGERAAGAATNAAVEEGSVGAGTGATVGKLYGLARAMKGGVGSATVWLDGEGLAGVRVAAMAVVNALGDIRDPESGHIIAGARVSNTSREFADAAYQLKRGAAARGAGFNFQEAQPANTTLVVVATNARLDKLQATRLAQQASIGVAKTISPVWTGSDGDICFALSAGDREPEPMALGIAAAEAVSQAIVRAVLRARSLGGVPGLAD